MTWILVGVTMRKPYLQEFSETVVYPISNEGKEAGQTNSTERFRPEENGGNCRCFCPITTAYEGIGEPAADNLEILGEPSGSGCINASP